ncbi:MFS transporter [Litoribrevibacter albus]|uniref:MFS transporter n=1 Tax=Litoribrevibacter albus TaxID=1473156 RepID=A0AA37SCC0_9GAMM|nr:MFS transporter [Litoribrevibacter albus]GLQ33697.1 MFS transporter [Litoribrevibacter albus]
MIQPDHRLLYLLTLLAYGILYAPQPILPALASEFNSSSNQAALLTTAVMLPLAIAPLSYGFLLEKISAKAGLTYSCVTMALCHVAFANITDINQAVAIRAIEGMTLPVMLTSIMTLLTRTTPGDKLQTTLSIYIALTIVGGLGGRTLSMLLTEYADWRTTFIILAVASLLLIKPLQKLPNYKPPHRDPIHPKEVFSCIKHRRNRYLFPFIMLQFFTMVAILNFIPFRIMQAFNTESYWPILLVYSFYIVAIGTALATINMRQRVSDLQFKGGLFWLAITALGLWSFSIDSLLMYCLGFMLVSGAIFANHSICSTEVNQNETKYTGLANGTYLTFYYTGGALGSILPGLWIQLWSWQTTLYIMIIGCVLSSAILCLYHKSKAT